MGAKPPVDHNVFGHHGERMVEAHRFFSEQAREWLAQRPGPIQRWAAAIETVVRELLDGRDRPRGRDPMRDRRLMHHAPSCQKGAFSGTLTGCLGAGSFGSCFGTTAGLGITSGMSIGCEPGW